MSAYDKRPGDLTVGELAERMAGPANPWGELAELRTVGDQLQSASSRVLEWLDQQRPPKEGTPYEVSLAMIETRDAITAWTEARRLAQLREIASSPTQTKGLTDGD